MIYRTPSFKGIWKACSRLSKIASDWFPNLVQYKPLFKCAPRWFQRIQEPCSGQLILRQWWDDGKAMLRRRFDCNVAWCECWHNHLELRNGRNALHVWTSWVSYSIWSRRSSSKCLGALKNLESRCICWSSAVGPTWKNLKCQYQQIRPLIKHADEPSSEVPNAPRVSSRNLLHEETFFRFQSLESPNIRRLQFRTTSVLELLALTSTFRSNSLIGH